MIACVDTFYTEEISRTALILFENWDASEAAREIVDELPIGTEDYVAGQFFKRELPCILSALDHVHEAVNTIVVDGYVWLDANGRRGLGAMLFEELGQSVVVIGAAKNEFVGSDGVPVLRGESAKPMMVTAAGIEPGIAAEHLRSMHGPFRIPTLFKRVDHLSRYGFGNS